MALFSDTVAALMDIHNDVVGKKLKKDHAEEIVRGLMNEFPEIEDAIEDDDTEESSVEEISDSAIEDDEDDY